MATKQSASLAKGLDLLRAVLADGGRSPLGAVAGDLGIPVPTAHRLALTLEAEGYLVRRRRGSFLPGPALTGLGAPPVSPHERVARRLRQAMARLAQNWGAFLHFGVLDEGMVTYVVKENGAGTELFTAESMQLEAYCSALGKVLLAALPAGELDSYLGNGPFIALTPRTLTDPDAIRRELDAVRAQGVAFDRYEVREDLFCMAVPVADPQGRVIGALSASFLGNPPDGAGLRQLRRALRKAAVAGATPDAAG